MNSKLIQDRVKKILDEGHLISLGVADSDGPWVADVIFAADESMNIYWMSDIESRHSEAIGKSAQIAGTITLSNKAGEKNLGLQISGIAEKIAGNDDEIARIYFTKRNKPVPAKGTDLLKGESAWYKLVPGKIELIDEENFGFSRQSFK